MKTSVLVLALLLVSVALTTANVIHAQDEVMIRKGRAVNGEGTDKDSKGMWY